MRKIDWKDYLVAFNRNGKSHYLAVKELNEKYPIGEVKEAQKEFEERSKNPLIKEAMERQNCLFSSGNPADLQLLVKWRGLGRCNPRRRKAIATRFFAIVANSSRSKGNVKPSTRAHIRKNSDQSNKKVKILK